MLTIPTFNGGKLSWRKGTIPTPSPTFKLLLRVPSPPQNFPGYHLESFLYNRVTADLLFSWCSEGATLANSWECRVNLRGEMCISHTTPGKVLSPNAGREWAGHVVQSWLSLKHTVQMGSMEGLLTDDMIVNTLEERQTMKMNKCTFLFWSLQWFQWGRKRGGIQWGNKLLVG